MGQRDRHVQLTRDELYSLVWGQPISKLARRYGLSDRGLAKICDRMGIPTPGRGYWAKVQSGQTPGQAKLPDMKPGQQDRVVITRQGLTLGDSEAYQAVAGQVIHEQDTANQIEVPEALDDPLPLIAKTMKSLGSAGANDAGIARPRARQCLDVRISKDSIDRATRFTDTLVRALQARDIGLIHDSEGEYGSQLVIDGETLGFCLEEKIRREPYQPTPAEQKKLDENRYYRYQLPDDKFVPTGRLCLKLETGYGSGLRSSWADGKKQRIEHCLNKFVATAYQSAAFRKAKRLEDEREERVRRERERQHAILRKQIEQEQARLNQLTEQARAWQEACQLRDYVQAVRSTGYYSRQTITGGRELDEWCAWALEQANRLDPTVTSPPSVLDYKDQFFWR